MKIILSFIVFFYTALFFAQTNNPSYDFEFYKNGYFKKTKNLKIQLAKNADTISCEITNGKIILLKNLDTCNVIVHFRKEKYVIEKVLFTNLVSKSKIIFGVENNIKNLKPMSAQFPNLYNIPNRLTFIDLKNLEQAKEVHFIAFTTEEKMENKINCRSYTQYYLEK